MLAAPAFGAYVGFNATTTMGPTTLGPFEGFPEDVVGYRMVYDDEEPRADDFTVRGLRYRRT